MHTRNIHFNFIEIILLLFWSAFPLFDYRNSDFLYIHMTFNAFHIIAWIQYYSSAHSMPSLIYIYAKMIVISLRIYIIIIMFSYDTIVQSSQPAAIISLSIFDILTEFHPGSQSFAATMTRQWVCVCLGVWVCVCKCQCNKI